MKVVFLLEAGIPSYRDFLFSHLCQQPFVSELIVVHTGLKFNGKAGPYIDKRVKFFGSGKFGTHWGGILKYLIDADVVISSYNLRIISCWLPAFVFRKKWVFWGKGLGDVDNSLVLYLRRLTSRWCRYMLVYNEVKKRDLINELRVDSNKVVAYQNSVFISNAFDYKGHEKSCFLYFGRIQERKGLIELVNNYKIYADQVGQPRYRLRLVGDGDFKESVITRVLELGISEFVDFHPGVYDDSDIAAHFKSALFYVSPYNVGLGVINSFAYGVPVITCRRPQVGPEFHYLNDQNSIIVDDISDVSRVFIDLDSNSNKNMEVFRYYEDHLHHSIMLKKFADIILKFKYEQS